MLNRLQQVLRLNISQYIRLFSVVIVLAGMPNVVHGTDEHNQLSIPEQPVDQALNELARETDLQFIFIGNIGKNSFSVPLQGEYTQTDAVKSLLDGTGLGYEFVDENTVIISPINNNAGDETGADVSYQDKNSILLADAGAGRTPLMVAQASTANTSSSSSATTTSRLLEEVVVTARKRSESLQDVPVTVQAFNSVLVEQAGITSMRDYVGMTTNMTLVETQNTGFAFVNIRGLSQIRNVDPTVAVVVDGVLSTTGLGFSQDMYDIEQIEVLKGPQGALYGRDIYCSTGSITTV